MKKYPLAETHRLLESGPVILLTTAHRGKKNIMVQSWHTMIDFDPPLIGCVVSDRNHSFKMLKASKECVINIPTEKLLKKVIGCGNTSGAEVDKFTKFRLTARPISGVQAPAIAECYASIACKVVDARLAGKYNFFMLQAVATEVDPAVKKPRTLHHLGRGVFMVAGKTVRTASKMK